MTSETVERGPTKSGFHADDAEVLEVRGVGTVAITRTTTADPGFAELAAELTAFLAELNGAAEVFYAPLNNVESVPHAVLAIADGQPIACGAFRLVDADTVEVKRMYVAPDWRGKGVSKKLLAELEAWAREVGCRAAILETSKRLDAANGFYRKSGYQVMPNYGAYTDAVDSVCMRKEL